MPPYKYTYTYLKILEMLLELMKLCEIMRGGGATFAHVFYTIYIIHTYFIQYILYIHILYNIYYTYIFYTTYIILRLQGGWAIFK